MEHDGLTLKQRTFAEEYVALKGNATKAALAAGYAKGKEPNAAVQGSENLRKPKIAKRIRQLTLKHEISADRVLKRLDNLSNQAQHEGQLGAAVKAEELIGKSLGMWIDRSISVSVDVSAEHLAALQDLLRARNADGVHSRISHIMESDDGDKDK